MRAIRINPYDRTVSEVETSGRAEGQGDALPGLYALLSYPAHMVDIFTVLSLDAGEGETLYLDDEGPVVSGPGRLALEGLSIAPVRRGADPRH